MTTPSLTEPRQRRWWPTALALASTALPLAAQAYNCGPNLLTYQATMDDTGGTDGVRCVKFQFNGAANGQPDFDLQWYGEGRDRGSVYRTLGATEPHWPGDPIVISAANITGNGEDFRGFEIGTIRPVVTEFSGAPSVIRMTGPMRQTWRLVSNMSYTPLPLPTVCGSHFITFEVRATSRVGPGPNVTGLRCLLPRPYSTAWMGVQNGLLQLGRANAAASGPNQLLLGGSSNICDSSAGRTCTAAPFPSLAFSHIADGVGYQVTGARSEYWMVPGSYVPPDPLPKPPGGVCARKPLTSGC